MTAEASEKEIRAKPRRFWWARGHPSEQVSYVSIEGQKSLYFWRCYFSS